MHVRIYSYWGNGTNTNMNNIWGPFYSNIWIFVLITGVSWHTLPHLVLRAWAMACSVKKLMQHLLPEVTEVVLDPWRLAMFRLDTSPQCWIMWKSGVLDIMSRRRLSWSSWTPQSRRLPGALLSLEVEGSLTFLCLDGLDPELDSFMRAPPWQGMLTLPGPVRRLQGSDINSKVSFSWLVSGSSIVGLGLVGPRSEGFVQGAWSLRAQVVFGAVVLGFIVLGRRCSQISVQV